MGTRLSHDRRPSGMDLAAQRLEMACGQIRAEIGRARTHPRWSGLLGRSPSGRWDPERDGVRERRTRDARGETPVRRLIRASDDACVWRTSGRDVNPRFR